MNWPLILTFCIVLPVLSSSLDDTPVDYLVPPPIAISSRAVATQHQDEEPSFFNRLTNWMFSFGRSYNPPNEQLVSSPSEKVINYHKPTNLYRPEKVIDDISCSPCNKIPWIPIVPNQVLHQSNTNTQINYKSSTVPTTKLQQTTLTFLQQSPTSYTSHIHTSTVHSTTKKQFMYVTFTTTQKPFKNDQFRGVTSPEYLPPKQVLPIENENRPFAPIPLPNLSKTPIPPLHEAKPFLYDPYKSFSVGTKFIPTYSNGTKYIESNLKYDSKKNGFLFSQSINSNLPSEVTTKSNVEIVESFPIAQFEQTTIEDDSSTISNLLQISTTTSNVDTTQSSIVNIYQETLNLSSGLPNLNNDRKTPIKYLDAPIAHYNKSESNVLPIIVSYKNDTTKDISIPNINQSATTSDKSNNVKPIRYIIPYTTQQKPSPFRAKYLRNDKNEDSVAGSSDWFPLRTFEQDIHDTQESSIVTATAPTPTAPAKTTKYIAKFLASSIKELLSKEKIESFTEKSSLNVKQSNRIQTEISTDKIETETKLEEIVPFDLTTFQQNINKWTEEQFGSTTEAAATSIDMVKYTKPIPVEYISQTISLPKITIATPRPVTTPSPIEKTMTSKHRPTYSDSLDLTLLDNLKSSFKLAKAYSKKSSNRNHAEQWKKVQVSISPLTHEKIYIVTPQTLEIQTDSEAFENTPRFSKRPTPGKRNLH